ncbi:MAG: phosphotransferase family protein [bacterium]|nr:phosphotransferase family protein [bacterium]
MVQSTADAQDLPTPPLLVVDSLIDYLDSVGLSSGGISWSRIGEGQSNVTFAIGRGGERYVLRRGPHPPLPPSTHDMPREAALLAKLRGAGVPVPEVLAVCTDDAVLGVPFYIMKYIDGRVITDDMPANLASREQRTGIVSEAVDSLTRLHQIDVTSGPLSTVGRPEGYLLRQVERFGSLWNMNSRRDLPDVARIGSWLLENLPTSQAATVVHGDYRIGNLMYSTGSPARLIAILDWEMATLGDPLADLGYLTATYAEPGSPHTPLDLTPVTRLAGFPSRADLVEFYCRSSSLDTTALPWYQTLALWKAAIFCEAMYSRWLDGERPQDTTFAPTLREGVPSLLMEAAHAASGWFHHQP